MSLDSGEDLEVLSVLLKFPPVSEDLVVEIYHIIVLSCKQARKLNELMFKMLVHVDFEASFLKFFNVLLNLDEHFISCVNLVLVVVSKALVGKFYYLFEHLLRFSRSDLGLDRCEDKPDLPFFNIIYLGPGRLVGRFSLYFLYADCVLLMSAMVPEGGFSLM